MDPVDRLFSQAAIRPDAIAVSGAESSCTYAEFCGLVNRMANQILQVRERRVLIAYPPGVAAYAAMFATLLAGGFYAPVSVPSRPEHLRRVAEAFRPSVILCSESLREIPGFGEGVFLRPDVGSQDFRARRNFRHDLAYVMFTSGSTGEPKGVSIPLSALEHYVDWLGTGMAIAPEDRMSQYPSISFDMSVLDIYGALCFGAELHPFVSEYDRLFPAKKIKGEGITVWNSVPSVVDLMTKSGQVTPDNLKSVRLFTFCGEPLRIDHLEALFEACPGAIIYNTYGPTETTVAVTCRRLTAHNYRALCDGTAPLGEPIGKMSIQLREIQGQLKELVIRGPQLARGYWENPEATAKVFRPVWTDPAGEREYSTGDIVELKNGELYFRGRTDRMVKVRGYRIELDAIVVALGRLGFTSCVGMESGRIVAVLEADAHSSSDLLGLRKRLSSELDPWALPDEIRVLQSLPRTKSDKIDIRLALQVSGNSKLGQTASSGGLVDM